MSTDDCRTALLVMHATGCHNTSAHHRGQGLVQGSPSDDAQSESQQREEDGEGETDEEDISGVIPAPGRSLLRSGALVDVINPSRTELAIASMVHKRQLSGGVRRISRQVSTNSEQRTVLPVSYAPPASGADLRGDLYRSDTSKPFIDLGVSPRADMVDHPSSRSSDDIGTGMLGDYGVQTGGVRGLLTSGTPFTTPSSPSSSGHISSPIAPPDVVVQSSHHGASWGAAKISESLSTLNM
ncbi:unnamed protein product [Peniophora sp. CBMAI 1063]|nr:unnamed protein product [Peniophora sp. CBMAI 1063]